MTDRATAEALANCQLLPGGRTINQYLSKRLYRRLKRHMEYIRRKIPDWMSDAQKSRPGVRADYYAEYQYR